jgi:capsular polysaccharide biosynthesis protein
MYGDPVSKRACLFTRNLFIQQCISSSSSGGALKRIYVSRGNVGRRRVTNEQDVLTTLSKKYGFMPVSMDQLSVKEQAILFYQAESIIAPHGAALTNLLFIQPHTKVIEMVPHGYVNNCFHIISSHLDANYYCLFGETYEDELAKDSLELNIEIDIHKLMRLCQQAGLDK